MPIYGTGVPVDVADTVSAGATATGIGQWR